MKEQLLSYRGYLNKEFCFVDNEGKLVRFKKSRNDLITDFELTKQKSVNQLFSARYFITYPGGIETYILSDLCPKS